MRCKDIRDYVERFVDRSLPDSKRELIEQHFATCRDCAVAYEEAAEIRRHFGKAVMPPVPGDLATVILTKVNHSAVDLEKQAGYFQALRHWWTGATTPARAAFACVLLTFAMAGIVLGRGLWNGPETQVYAGFPELDAFSAAQEGSLEKAYLQMTALPSKGYDK
jgi:anti-sigma factor RsiW